jgi:uncharacterized protein YkwD
MVCCFVLLSAQEQKFSADAYSKYQNAVLAEVNLARTSPLDYIGKRLSVEVNKHSDNGAGADLKKLKPLEPLSLNPLLTKSAQEYADFLAAQNRFGHNEKGTPVSRIAAAGYIYSTLGENIACGNFPDQNAEQTPEAAAVSFVKQWIIDRGVAGVGHRKNILSSRFTEMGIGFGRNIRSTYGNYTVQDFGSPR